MCTQSWPNYHSYKLMTQLRQQADLGSGHFRLTLVWGAVTPLWNRAGEDIMDWFKFKFAGCSINQPLLDLPIILVLTSVLFLQLQAPTLLWTKYKKIDKSVRRDKTGPIKMNMSDLLTWGSLHLMLSSIPSIVWGLNLQNKHTKNFNFYSFLLKTLHILKKMLIRKSEHV